MQNLKWYERSYRRNLVDMHIEDWDERFLSEFDPYKYADLLKKARIQSAMIYANSHVGYCYWPTESGHMHAGLKGRDILGEVVDLTHGAGIDVILYYSLVYNNWAYDFNKSWRIKYADNRASREVAGKDIWGGRYGVCCPNSKGYRDFTHGQIKELCNRYDFEGVFFDMTFWPAVCYCDSCKERYKGEVGSEIPTVVNWQDPAWITFQKKREEWLTEFAYFATNAVKKLKPATSVEHQFSPATSYWLMGTTEGIAKASDYAGGDLYGGFMQQSFVCKLYHSISPNQPFEYMTSRCYPNLGDHTTMKSRQMLELHTYLTLAHSGAFLIIDAIDPVGTLNPKVYETIGSIFEKSREYEPYLGGRFINDVAVFFSLVSKMDYSDNFKQADKTSANEPHLDAALGAARILKENHMPFGVISSSNLKDLSAYQILVLPDVLVLSAEEADMIRDFVKNGGSLYLSGHTSLELLGDVAGALYAGEIKEPVSYMAPTERGSILMPEVDAKYPLTIFGTQVKVNPESQDDVMATITLPYTDPCDFTGFASIHSNPPGHATDYPAIIRHKYGKGKVIWVSAPLEAAVQDPHKNTFAQIIKSLAIKPFAFEVDALPAVEVLLFKQEEEKRLVINAVNIQEQLPLIPLSNVKIKVRLNGSKVKSASILPCKEPAIFEIMDDYALILLPSLDVFSMVELIYD